MVHASVAQVPIFGGKLKRYDESKIKGMRGVKAVVVADDWVAVVADNWWRANQALKAMPIEWDGGDNAKVSSESIGQFLRTGIDAKELPAARKDGDVNKAFAEAAKTLEAEYYAPFLNHATMEPQTATALAKPDEVEVWVGTQNGEVSIAAAADAAGLKQEQVILHKMHAGGAFGRRTFFNEFARQAIKIAQTMPGTPVRVQWSREEDMQQGRYRPVALVKVRGALDKDGNWIGWQVRQSEPSFSQAMLPQFVKDGVDQIATRVFNDHPYSVPNYINEYAMRNTHVPLGPWRAVAHTHNPIFRECFVDEMAKAAGKDPYQFRKSLLDKRPKDLACLEAVAKAIGWGTNVPGVYKGLAVSDSYGSFSAASVEIGLKDGKVIDVKRVVVALDPGYVVHPDAAKAQIESGVIWALSAMMFEEITIKDGRVVQTNFSDYPVLTLKDTPPKIESLLMPSGGFWGGVGEPPMAAVGPAICNAIFAATGKGVRSVPLKNAGFSYA